MDDPKHHARPLTKEDIARGLTRIGIRNGDCLLVHSSLASFGRVEGGADTVIDALLDTVGHEGTVMVPTFDCGDPIFDPKRSETTLGAVPSALWKRVDAIRSRHPLASVAAIGAKAEWLARGHENARLGHGEDTPYMRLAECDGKVLLLGVDQDRSTFLHVAEELAAAAYLKPVSGTYLEEAGNAVTRTWPYFPGPHRNFIGLQSWLESQGLVKKTLIGSCISQAMPARELLEALSKRIEREQGLFISGNPNLPDGVAQNADILRQRRGREAFTLAVDSQFSGPTIEKTIDNCRRFGIDAIMLSFVNDQPWERIPDEIRQWYLEGLRLAGIQVRAIRFIAPGPKLAAKLIAEAQTRVDARQAGGGGQVVPAAVLRAKMDTAVLVEIAKSGASLLLENTHETGNEMVRLFDDLDRLSIRASVAFNPLAFVQIGENPFLGTYMKTRIKNRIGLLYLNDGLATGERRGLEEGLAEVKELMSILRCRSFKGLFILQSAGPDRFREAGAKFHSLLREMGAWPAD